MDKAMSYPFFPTYAKTKRKHLFEASHAVATQPVNYEECIIRGHCEINSSPTPNVLKISKPSPKNEGVPLTNIL